MSKGCRCARTCSLSLLLKLCGCFKIFFDLTVLSFQSFRYKLKDFPKKNVRALCPRYAFLNCFQLFLFSSSTKMQIRIFLGSPILLWTIWEGLFFGDATQPAPQHYHSCLFLLSKFWPNLPCSSPPYNWPRREDGGRRTRQEKGDQVAPPPQLLNAIVFVRTNRKLNSILDFVQLWRSTVFIHFCLFSNMSNYRLQSLVN